MDKFAFIKSNIYFKYLKIINNKVEASCNICRKKIIDAISSSSNLRRHYKTVHHTKLDEYDKVKCEHNENSKKRQLQEPSELSYTKKIKQSSLVLKNVEDFKYLGAWIDSSAKDLKIRKALAWRTCYQMRNI